MGRSKKNILKNSINFYCNHCESKNDKEYLRKYILSTLELFEDESYGLEYMIMSIILFRRYKKPNIVKFSIKHLQYLFMTCFILSFKLNEDLTYQNIFYDLFNIDSETLTELEFKFCKAVNFKIFIKVDEYVYYLNILCI